MVRDSLFWILLIFFALQCLFEVFISYRNQQWIKKKGGIEFGKDHFKWIVFLMIFFFIAVPFEKIYFQKKLVFYWSIFLGFFIFGQGLRYWAIFSLGRYWNSRIWVIPESPKINKGPYRYMKHPNYWAVVIILSTLPLMVGCYWTALFTTIGYFCFLKVRISTEEKALSLLK